MRAAFLVFAILSLSGIANAQSGVRPSPSPTPRSDDQEPVRVFTEEVRLPIAATDTYGHYDPTLTVNDVLILEDGQAQQIRSIQHLPGNVLLLLDVGNQLGLKDTNLTRDVALRVVNSLFAGTRFAIMQFAMKPELLQPWTSDKSGIEKVLKTKMLSGKSSRLADAFAAAADQFKETAPGTRHIVIITDGVDTPGGKITMANALKQLNSIQASLHILSYTVMERQELGEKTKVVSGGDGVQRDGNPGSNPVANGDPTLPPGVTRTPSFKIGSIDTDIAMRRKRKEYERATRDSEKQLTSIAEESGGRIFLPANKNEILDQAGLIARDIGSQYVVTYRPTRPLSQAKAGEYRKIEVASRRVGLYLRSRRGYVVSNNQ
ncbi:MAG TPA: VWA domain-containing protein [Pyrinomonadaceae bacterium]|nr:VWA domain-containing protein [Pyrinomonadaceae bacterium]